MGGEALRAQHWRGRRAAREASEQRLVPRVVGRSEEPLLVLPWLRHTIIFEEGSGPINLRPTNLILFHRPACFGTCKIPSASRWRRDEPDVNGLGFAMRQLKLLGDGDGWYIASWLLGPPHPSIKGRRRGEQGERRAYLPAAGVCTLSSF